MCWRHRDWMHTAAMSPFPDIATAWTCITAATISQIGTGLSAPSRATAPRTWHRLRSADRPGTGLCRTARHHLPRPRRRDHAQAVAGKRPRQDRWIAGGSALPRRRCARRGRRAATGKGKCREGGGPRHRNRGAGTGIDPGKHCAAPAGGRWSATPAPPMRSLKPNAGPHAFRRTAARAWHGSARIR